MSPDLTDEEIDGICRGYTQNAAKIRHLIGLGLRVERRPNGRPLVARVDWNRRFEQDKPANQGTMGPKWRVAA